jgi:pilus assembly protein CpaC
MKKIIFPILAFLFLVQAQGWSAGPQASRTSEKKARKQELLLIAGIQSTLDINFEPCPNNKECIRVANQGLVDVAYINNKKQLVFTPIKRGETTITIRDEKADIALILKVMVSENNISRRVQELKELLRDVEGIEFKVMGEKIVLDGEVVVLSDLNRINTILNNASYKDSVVSLVGVSPVGMQIMAERIQAEINRPSVKVRPFNGFFVLEGTLDSEKEVGPLVTIAKSMLQGYVIQKFPDVEGSPLEVRRGVVDPVIPRFTFNPRKSDPPKKMVRVTVDFVELSKDYLRNFGFMWAPSLDTGNGQGGGTISFGQSTTGGVTAQGSGTLSGTIAQLFPKLNSAQRAGYARVLEESVMIVKDGDQASFKRQLDIPIQTVNDRGQPVFNKVSVGPAVNVVPKISQSDDVELAIEFGYNALAGREANIPLILAHNYKSSLIVKNAESAAIVNALSTNISTAFNKDPPGGNAPSNPLFNLLRSKAFQKQKSQFVVFVTPQVIQSASTGTEDIKNKFGLKRKQ